MSYCQGCADLQRQLSTAQAETAALRELALVTEKALGINDPEVNEIAESLGLLDERFAPTKKLTAARALLAREPTP